MLAQVGRLVAVVVTFLPTFALAHGGHDDVAGYWSGFAHPLTGYDHFVAMIAVGILACQIGEKTLWLLPVAFLVAMGLGGILSQAGQNIPYVEIGIALSAVVLGAGIVLGNKTVSVAAIGVTGAFAIFHGYAHFSEIPLVGSREGHVFGFMSATALLHLLGIAIGIALGRYTRHREQALQAAGYFIVILGAITLLQATMSLG